ncbi:MAG: oligosaccharide flippase family protein, partial [Thermoplasmata archaeon]|nr:oligosaccharide flippase family protein [Thermoplasmata archaeon]
MILLKSEHKSIGRKVTWIFFIKIVLTITSWIGTMFVARFMGVEVFGMIGFAVGLCALFLHTDFGFSLAHNKRVSEGKDVDECIGAYIRIKLVITSLLVFLLLFGLFIWEKVLGYGYQDPVIRSIVYIILIYYVLFALSQIPIQTFGGLRQSAKQQMPEFIGTFARMPIMVVVALTSLGVVALALSYVVTGIVMISLGFIMMRKFKSKKPSKKLLRSYITFATPLSIYIFFSTISLHLDKVVIQLFWDFNEVGTFFGMQKIIMVIILVTSSLGPILFPSISHLHSKKAMRSIRHLVRRAERYLSMLVTPIVIMCIVLATPIIHILLGDEFLGGTEVLAWLSIYALMISLNSPHMHLLNGCGRSNLSAKVGLSIAFINITLLFLFVPRDLLGYELFGLGSVGAAMASTISVVVGFILARHY